MHTSGRVIVYKNGNLFTIYGWLENFDLIIGDQTNQPAVQSPAVSLEEREAAYQAARERIFSERASLSPDSSLEQRDTQRARPVPVVARRMIAHALGKPQVLTADSPPSEIVGISSIFTSLRFTYFTIHICMLRNFLF